MDAGALGVSLIGRAALAEGGEKISAASRLCELQASAMYCSEKYSTICCSILRASNFWR